jgi:hypothetical protein
VERKASPDPSLCGEYNHSTFATSEARGKTRVFANVVHAGEEAPDFALPTLEGGRVELRQFRGERYVVLEFRAVTCPPFVGEVSPLNELHQTLSSVLGAFSWP